MTADQFASLMQKKYNRKSFRGLELINAAGDVNVTGLAYQYTLDRLTYMKPEHKAKHYMKCHQLNPPKCEFKILIIRVP